ncbi:hypothetical protein SK128_015576 [Halocaridina rubra]|uniref:Uncharacterized protein n=1 Tax=Halocaridina rubra TaxID=373956 RepID=A0AAN8WXM7_HALRR
MPLGGDLHRNRCSEYTIRHGERQGKVNEIRERSVLHKNKACVKRQQMQTNIAFANKRERDRSHE